MSTAKKSTEKTIKNKKNTKSTKTSVPKGKSNGLYVENKNKIENNDTIENDFVSFSSQESQETKNEEYTAENLLKIIESLKKQVIDLESKKNVTPEITNNANFGVSKMDRPCTIIHMIECANKNLPTTIVVNGIVCPFTRFGEKRTFRFSDLQNLVPRYSEFFERGIFTFGDDCIEFLDELPVDAYKTPMSVTMFNKMVDMTPFDFEKLFKSVAPVIRVHIARMWRDKINANIDGYRDFEKVGIINKYTDGYMKDIISEMIDGGSKN